MHRWYVLRSKPRKEFALVRFARAQGHQIYCPALRVDPVNPRASKRRAYFPGYLFVHTELGSVGESTFRWMPLSQGLVHVGGEPASVHEGVIDVIRKRVEVLMETGDLEADTLSHGEQVLVSEGYFEGYDGIFDVSLSGGERTRILLRMMHDRFVPVEMDRTLIRRAQLK